MHELKSKAVRVNPASQRNFRKLMVKPPKMVNFIITHLRGGLISRQSGHVYSDQEVHTEFKVFSM